MTVSFEPAGLGVERIALRTPTLPPATETNSYLVHRGGECYLVEPATPHAAERKNLFEEVRRRAATGERLQGAILTHHHHDHVGAAEAFRTEFGVPLFAHATTRDRLLGRVTVDRLLADGDTLLEGFVRVLHTPGHAPGHLCLWSEQGHWLIAGDMVASVGTIVIDPDDGGDMREYLVQLARLGALPLSRILPAHGDPVDRPGEHIGFYIAHRQERERKVLGALSDRDAVELSMIVERAYADTSPWLWPLASKSARAHLVKLEREGKIRREGERWRRVD